MSETRSWSDTLPCAADSRQDMATVFASRVWGEKVTSYRGNLHQDGSSVTRETSRGSSPHCPFVKLWWRCSDLKIRTITSWARGQVCRHLQIRLYD